MLRLFLFQPSDEVLQWHHRHHIPLIVTIQVNRQHRQVCRGCARHKLPFAWAASVDLLRAENTPPQGVKAITEPGAISAGMGHVGAAAWTSAGPWCGRELTCGHAPTRHDGDPVTTR